MAEGNIAIGATTGALGGAGIGASIGTAVMPGVGTLIGAGIGALAGGLSGGALAGKKENAMNRLEELPAFDPRQLSFLDDLQRERRSIKSGFTTDFQVATDLNKQAYAGGLSVAESVARTNPALGLAYMNRAGKNFDTGINKALGTISSRSTAYTQAVASLIDSISQRGLDVETYKIAQDLGMSVSDLKAFNENMLLGAAKLPGELDGLPGLLQGSTSNPSMDLGFSGTSVPDGSVASIPSNSLPTFFSR